jgi:hypothetical protein
MTAPAAMVECPECCGAGEIQVCVNDGNAGCSHTNDRVYGCWVCNTSGEVRSDQVDREGEFMPDGCNCDMDDPCNNPVCVMERELEERRFRAAYRRGVMTPAAVSRQMWAEALVEAGRGHLVRNAAWDEEAF